MDYNNVPPTPGYNGQSYMSFVDAIKVCFNKYCCFSGRASRAEYWWWVLFTFIVGVVLGWLEFTGTAGKIIYGLVNLALILPNLGVSVRRMHDIGKGGGYIFINLIPIVGWILWIIWCVKQSEPMPNRFGDVPA